MSIRDVSLLHKLKEGIEEAVVFLRTLEQFRIPAVVESRRKKLLERLELLQGDTIRASPPRYSIHEESESRGLKRADSLLVSERVKELEETDAVSKQPTSPKSEAGSPKKSVSEDTESRSSKEAVVLREKKEGMNELKPERPSSTASAEVSSVGSADEGDKKEEEKTKKKKKGGGIGGFFKRKKTDKVEKTEKVDKTEKVEKTEKEEKAENGDKSDQESVSMGGGDDNDAKMQGQLERKVGKRFGGHNWVKQTVSLRGCTLFCSGEKDKDKETVELVGCTAIASSEAATILEVGGHAEHKQLAFRAESEEARDQWLAALGEAIQSCTPAVEGGEQAEGPTEEAPPPEEPKPEGDVPKITVEEHKEETQPEEETESLKKKTSKRLSVIPEQGVEKKGYAYRKNWKKKWEKCFCVLSYQALYFTTSADNKEYTHVLHIVDQKSSLTREKKGHDKSAHSLLIKTGGKKEQMSLESSEACESWYQALEQVMGLSVVEELASEDEEGGVEPIDEDLYEEVDRPAPPVPASPRPPHKVPEQTVDDFQDMAGEDIYEEFDDVIDAIQPESLSDSFSPEPPPSLPPRNELKEPVPKLPPRNSPATSPSLPLRGVPKNKSQGLETSSAKAPPRPPPPGEIEELYDDVIPGGGGEGAVDEEFYEDVVVHKVAVEDGPEENYEDMGPVPDPNDGPQEEYVIMEPGQEGPEELYDEVSAGAPSHAIGAGKTVSQSGGAFASSVTDRVSTISRMFGGKKSSLPAKLHSGKLSYKAPGKPKFKEEWCVIEGVFLQFYKSSSDKKSHDRLPLNECSLIVGSTDPGAGEFAFRLTKGDKLHHFGAQSREDLNGWIAVLKDAVKSAVLDISESNQVYRATQDHIAETPDQLTFKKGTLLRLVSKDSAVTWTGQLGTESQVFEGAIGKFPCNKVEEAEDLYI